MNFTEPSLPLLCKLGSIVVHCDEARSPSGHNLDLLALDTLLADPEVKNWISSMGALLPLKRSNS
jgi:hypothetical protein